MNVLIVVALLVVAGMLARVVRRMDDLKIQIDHAVDETNVEASITRRYLGKLTGDPGLQEPDCGSL